MVGLALDFRMSVTVVMDALLKRDFALEAELELQRVDLQGHRCRERLDPGDGSRGKGVRNRVLDLTLRPDADRLEELAKTEIEGFLVHAGLRAQRRPTRSRTRRDAASATSQC